MALLFVCALCSLLASVLGTDCPDTWVAFHGSCYKFAKDPAIHTHAEEYCRQHHESHLVHIETRLENQFIKTYIQDSNSPHPEFWIGMTDETVEDMWVWQATDSPVNFTDWNPTEPQNSNDNEDCAIMTYKSHFGWADVPCFWTFRPICELSGGTCTSTSIIG